MFRLVKVETENEATESEQKELEDLNSSEIDEEIKNILEDEDNSDLPF